MKTKHDTELFKEICGILKRLENENKLVICSAEPNGITKEIYNLILQVPHPIDSIKVSELELASVRQLILYVISDKKFFDWELNAV